MMACGLSKSLGLPSSLKMKQQGIVTILGCDGGGSSSSTTPSLKRTFSADLSSKNWLSQIEFSPMKRISSSEKLCSFGATNSLSSGEAEEGSRSEFDIWTKIQEDKNNNNNKDEEIEPGQSDVWSSILSAKKSNDEVPPPYVHPLMKRASSLSEKSLKICTESLGSETGCEGFSSSETEDGDTDRNQEEKTLFLNVIETEEEETESEVEVEMKSITVPDHTTSADLPRGSFPPPIRSLSSQPGASLQMKTHRDNGRLVLEAVSVPSQNNFSANRQNGRLLLTFAETGNKPNYEVDIAGGDKEDEIDSEIQWLFDEEEEEKAKEEFAYKLDGLQYKLSEKPIGPVTVHRLAHKPIGIPKRNTRWPPTDEHETKFDLTETPVVHSLPPRPRVAQLARSTKPPSTVDDTVGAACFNTCDYYWKPTNTGDLGLNTKAQFQAQNIVKESVKVGIDDWINGCKERRKSLLSVEPFCIAT